MKTKPTNISCTLLDEEATNSIKRSNSSNGLVEMKGINHLIHVSSKIKNGEGKREVAASLCEGTVASFCAGKKRFIILNPNP